MEIRVLKGLDNGGLKNKNCINLINFGVCERIDFKKQLQDKATELIALGKLSKELGGITLIGAESDNCGIIKKSVFVFEGARLTAICDMNKYQEKYSSSFGYKIINFLGKKIGVLVDRDVFDPRAVYSLTSCGVGGIINLYEGFCAKKAIVASEFYSYVYGVDFICLAKDKLVAFNAFGESESPSLTGEIKLDFNGVYREEKRKIRGV